MGIIGKIKYYSKKYFGDLGKDYGVYEPSKSIPENPPAPSGYEYTGTVSSTGGGIIVTQKTPITTSKGGGAPGGGAPVSVPVQYVTTSPPQKQTIQNQMNLNKQQRLQPTSVTTASDFYTSEYQQPWYRSFGQSLKQATKVGIIGTAGFEAYLQGIASPYQYAEGGAKVGSYTDLQMQELKEADIGTPFVDVDVVRNWEKGISESELIGKIKKTKEKKYTPEYEAVFNPLQEQVYAGSLSVPEAEKLLSEQTASITSRYEKELIGSTSGISTRGKKFSANLPSAIKLTALAGVGMSGYVGSTLAGGYLMGDLYKGYGKGLLGKDLKFSQRTFEIGKGTFYGASGLALFGGAIKGLGQEITYGEISELAGKTPRFNLGQRIKVGKGVTRDIYYSYDTLGGSQRVIRVDVVSRDLGVRDLSKVRAVTETYIKAYGFPTGKPLSFGARGTFEGIGYTTPIKAFKGGFPSVVYGQAGKSWEFATYGTKASQINIFSKYYPKQETFIGGIAEQKGDFIKALGGEITNVKFSPGNIQYSFNVQDISLIKNLKKTSFGSSFVSRGTSSQLSKSLGIKVAKFSAPSISLPVVKTNLGFAGLTGLTGQKTRTKVTTTLPSLSISSLKLPTKTKSKTKFFGGLLTSDSTITIPKENLFQITPVAIIGKEIQKQITKTIFPISPATIKPAISPFPTSFKFPILPLWKPKLDLGRAKGGGFIGGKGIFGYTPSYSAFVLGIRGRKATPPTFKGKYTGFEIRKLFPGWKSPFGFGSFGKPRRKRRRRK